MPLNGYCLCKAVTYTIDVDEPLITGYDHCDDCQRQTGSTYCKQKKHPPANLERLFSSNDNGKTALVAVVPKDKVVMRGPVKKWTGKGSSGNDVHRIFCSECGSPIAHDPDAAPEIIAMKAGTLDPEQRKELKPVSSFLFSPCTFYFPAQWHQ